LVPSAFPAMETLLVSTVSPSLSTLRPSSDEG
jgi:hypothetical protein